MRYVYREGNQLFTFPDGILLAALGILLIICTAILFSVDPRLFPVQWLYIGVGLFVLWFFSRLDFIILESFVKIMFASVVLALIATLAIGIVNKGALRWLSLGPFTLQVSEFAKPILALMSAYCLANYGRYGFILSLISALVIVLIVFIQPDLGTAIIIFTAWFGSIFSSRVSFKAILALGIVGALLFPLGWFVLYPYQKERILSFISPHDTQGTSYQSLQSMVAIGSGGLFGSGLGQGTQTQLRFLPARHTDFIYASIGEELGFAGMALVLASFLIILWRILKKYFEASNKFSQYAIAGIFFYLFMQTFINIAMNLGMLPVVGVPLPIISSGGSALVSTMMALGFVMALSRKNY